MMNMFGAELIGDCMYYCYLVLNRCVAVHVWYFVGLLSTSSLPLHFSSPLTTLVLLFIHIQDIRFILSTSQHLFEARRTTSSTQASSLLIA